MIRVAINGFGRIGRTAFKVAIERKDIEIVAVNDLGNTQTLAHLLRYDSVYGRYEHAVEVKNDFIKVKGKKISVFAERDPRNLPWKKLQIDVVLECTGIFLTKEMAMAHINAGAKGVIISAPAKDEKVKSCVLGVNDHTISGQDRIIDNASCTTNSVAPVAAIMKEFFGIKKAAMTTAHAYTANQNLVDGPNKDLRRARAAAQNIIPTSTGAAIATTRIIPQLQNKFDGIAIRVPVLCGSLTDFTFIISKKTTIEEVKNVFIKAAKSKQYKGILGVTDEPIVSSDILKSSYSALVDLNLINVIDSDLVKVFAWYDNEWGYSNRLIEMVFPLVKKLK